MLAAKFEVILPHLDERQRRLLLGAEARVLGHGGIQAVARAAGVRPGTVSAGVDELEAGAVPLGRVRRAGAGRKQAAVQDAGLLPALLALVEPGERGDPESPLRWTTKSLRDLAGELTARGHRVSHETVADLLRRAGYSLQGNAKVLEGRQHPDRDAQFGYINEQAKDHLNAGDPVVSVDTKKKELVGAYANKGRQWLPQGEPLEVLSHDFPDRQGTKAIPYGIYDVAANTGWVGVGTDHDTAAFAVGTLRRWWDSYGRVRYPDTHRLLITADAGGSNSARARAWKIELAAFAADTGLSVTVCHFPPGTSKWNRIEHRLFSHISINWRGRPLTSHDVVVNTIAATTTDTGLRVHAELDTGHYPTGTKITDQQMAALPIERHDWHGDWNYTLHPTGPAPAETPAPASAKPARIPDLTWLADPAITGMTTTALHELTTRITVPYQAQREQILHNQRGRPRQRTGGRSYWLDMPQRLLITILRDRHQIPSQHIADLYGLSLTTITVALREIHNILTQIGHTIKPATKPLTIATIHPKTMIKPAS